MNRLRPSAHMLSQKRAKVLGFSWLRRCLNQRWMVLTSQSSCLDRPSNLFSSGCWRGRKESVVYPSAARGTECWATFVWGSTNQLALPRAVLRKHHNIKMGKGVGGSGGATLVIAVKTFSRMALACAFCGPLA